MIFNLIIAACSLGAFTFFFLFVVTVKQDILTLKQLERYNRIYKTEDPYSPTPKTIHGHIGYTKKFHVIQTKYYD